MKVGELIKHLNNFDLYVDGTMLPVDYVNTNIEAVTLPSDNSSVVLLDFIPEGIKKDTMPPLTRDTFDVDIHNEEGVKMPTLIGAADTQNRVFKPAPPTCEDLYNCEESEDYEEIENKPINTWRWGTTKEAVFKRKTDNTYWCASYLVSTDGETDELADGCASIYQVEPKEVTVIKYVPVGSK